MGNTICIAYTDGSFNPNTNLMGCAVVLICGKKTRPHRIAFSRQLNSLEQHGSNIAEMIAAKTAIKTACSLGLRNIDLYYDWDGIENFSHHGNIKNRHKKCPKFAEYANYMENARKNIDISFIKVKAHSHDKLNCLVDRMAKHGKTL